MLASRFCCPRILSFALILTSVVQWQHLYCQLCPVERQSLWSLSKLFASSPLCSSLPYSKWSSSESSQRTQSDGEFLGPKLHNNSNSPIFMNILNYFVTTTCKFPYFHLYIIQVSFLYNRRAKCWLMTHHEQDHVNEMDSLLCSLIVCITLLDSCLPPSTEDLSHGLQVSAHTHWIFFKKCTTWELQVKFYLGQNEDGNPGEGVSDSAENLLLGGEGRS